MNKNAMKSENYKEDWCTPPWLFKRLQKVFEFEVDGASDGINNLLPQYICKGDYLGYGSRFGDKVFTNPPFNKLEYFLSIYTYRFKFNCLLLPFRPETKIWHKYIWPEATIFVFNKRIQYIHPITKQEVKGAAFPSCLVFFGDLSEYPIETLNDLGVWIRNVGKSK